MAQSYTRQSTFSDGDTITASLFNNEYNQLLNSFSYSASNASTTGHRHDGTAGQGGNIFKVGDLDFLNKIEVDSTNNRWGFYVEVSSAAVEQIRVQDGAIVPVTDNDIDLGTSSLQFKDIYINGTANLDSLVLSSGTTVTVILDEDDLSTNSATALATQQSIKAYVDAQVTAQDFDFSADSGGALSIDLDSEAMTFTGGTGIDTSGSGNAVTFAIDSTVATLTGSQTLTNKTITSPDINGGTVDGATIATSDITVGSGKTLDVSAGTLTLADNQISGDKVEGGTIAATTITDLTFGSLDDGTINITAFVDEDNMSSDSATLVPTQQSVKAYVDSQVTAQDLDVTTDSGTIAIDLDSETLTVSGGTGLDSSATGNAVTLAIDSTVATLTGSQTLTNKTLTSPDINTPDIDGGTIDGTVIGGATPAAVSATTVAASGNITVGGTVDGRDVAADGTKLDGVEASADVTDTTNVTAAGALMDSEVTNLAQVKAFDSSDYATAAQGTTADAALPKAGGAMTGAITTNSTFDGRDVATDGTKLDGIEASADVTDTANVTSAGALMDSELTAIASVKALNQGVATGDSPTFTNLTLSGTGSVKVPAGTTGQRDGSPAAGMFRYNSSLAQFEGYTDAWGAIGGGGTNTFTTDSFTGNGSTTAYALSQTVSSEDNLLVFIEGVFQQQDAYSIATSSGTTTLTFSAAPANGNAILIYSVAAGISGSNLNIDSMTGDGSDVTLTLSISPVNENNTQVFIDGVYQSKSNYSISGTTLTFSTAPPTGTAVEVMTFTQTDINVPVDGTITSAKLSGDLTTPGALTVTGAFTSLGIDDNANATAITIDASENVGIGGSPASLLDVSSTGEVISTVRSTSTSGARQATLRLNVPSTGGDDPAGRVQFTYGTGYTVAGSIEMSHSTNNMKFSTGTTERMRIDSSGNVGVSVTPPAWGSAYANVNVGTAASFWGSKTGASLVAMSDNSYFNGSAYIARNTGAGSKYYQNAGGHYWDNAASVSAGAAQTNVERMRIDSSGRLLINTASILTGSSAKLQVLQTVTGEWSQRINNSAASPYGLTIGYTSASPNGTANQFHYCTDTGGARWGVYSNGGVLNYSGNNVNLSDRNAKKDITLHTDDEWNCVKAWEIVDYRYNDEADDSPAKIGVIAQQIQEHCPDLVNVFQEQADAVEEVIGEDGEVVTEAKAAVEERIGVNEAQMMWMVTKALQEAMTRIETLEAKVQTLENN